MKILSENTKVWSKQREGDQGSLQELRILASLGNSCLLHARTSPNLVGLSSGYVLCYVYPTVNTRCREVTITSDSGIYYDVLFGEGSWVWSKKTLKEKIWQYTPLEDLTEGMFLPRTFGGYGKDMYPEAHDFLVAEIHKCTSPFSLLQLDIPGYENCIVDGNITV